MTLLSAFLICAVAVQAQSKDELLLLKRGVFNDTVRPKAKPGYVFRESHWLVKYNPVSLVFGGALFVYQRTISPQIMQGCAFEPSCSNFSKQCIHEFGIVKGIALTTDRLTRCTRLSAIDFHPVLITADKKSRDVPGFYRLRK